MSRLQQAWQTRRLIAYSLLPVSLLFALLTKIRREGYRRGWLKSDAVSVPVVVVGNISVGGTGKTPLCAHLVQTFQSLGWNPGIVSRGYGGLGQDSPRVVSDDDTAAQIGDEPLMLARETKVPVCVCVNRASAVEYLALHKGVDIVFSDDGLQHLKMPRVAEIIVIDGQRGFGNGWLLPAGPLREPISRIDTQHQLIAIQKTDRDFHPTITGNLSAHARKHTFRLALNGMLCLQTGKRFTLDAFRGRRLMALAGIGHPDRFFSALRQAGIDIVEAPRTDHHKYTMRDPAFNQPLPVVVTPKDAVKVQALGLKNTEVYRVITGLDTSAHLAGAIERLEQSLTRHRDDRQ